MQHSLQFSNNRAMQHVKEQESMNLEIKPQLLQL